MIHCLFPCGPCKKAMNYPQTSPLSPKMSLVQLGLVCSLFNNVPSDMLSDCNVVMVNPLI